jgi:hypothetical protein
VVAISGHRPADAPAHDDVARLDAGDMSGARIGQERLESGAGQRGRGLGVDWCVSNEQTEDDPAEEQVGGGSTFRSG